MTSEHHEKIKRINELCDSIPMPDGRCLCPFQDDPDPWCAHHISQVPPEQLDDIIVKLEGANRRCDTE